MIHKMIDIHMARGKGDPGSGMLPTRGCAKSINISIMVFFGPQTLYNKVRKSASKFPSN